MLKGWCVKGWCVMEVRINCINDYDMWDTARRRARQHFPQIGTIGLDIPDAYFKAVEQYHQQEVWDAVHRAGVDTTKTFKWWKDDWTNELVFQQKEDN